MRLGYEVKLLLITVHLMFTKDAGGQAHPDPGQQLRGGQQDGRGSGQKGEVLSCMPNGAARCAGVGTEVSFRGRRSAFRSGRPPGSERRNAERWHMRDPVGRNQNGMVSSGLFRHLPAGRSFPLACASESATSCATHLQLGKSRFLCHRTCNGNIKPVTLGNQRNRRVTKRIVNLREK